MRVYLNGREAASQADDEGSIPFTRSSPPRNLSTDISLIAHCDWSKDAAKRWMCVAVRVDTQWQILPPEPVGETRTLFDRLEKRKRDAGALLVGFDFTIGLPRAYAEIARIPDFRTFLGQIGDGRWDNWFNVCNAPDQIGISRPFYPERPGGAKRAHLLNALGLANWNDLLRLCERASSDRQEAASLFWTMGGNQVGKAAISGWNDIIIPNLCRIALWPFEGSLEKLVATRSIVIAETYPGDIYARLDFPKRGWSKRRQSDRMSLAPSICSWLGNRDQIDSRTIHDLIGSGFGGDLNGEDRFDAFVGVLGMIDVVIGERREGVPDLLEIETWEGWILGQVRSTPKD